MEIIGKIVKSPFEPKQTNVGWFDTSENELKFFINGRWAPSDDKVEVASKAIGDQDGINIKSNYAKKSEVDLKIDSPNVPGVTGQVLQLDLNRKPEWVTPSAGTTPDSQMSDGSTNAVQNKVIKEYIDGEIETLDLNVAATADQISQLGQEINGGPNYIEGFYLNSSGEQVADADYCISEKVFLSNDALTNGIYWYYGTYKAGAFLFIYDENGNVIDYFEMLPGIDSRRISAASLGANASYIRFSFAKNYEGRIDINTSPHTILWKAEVSTGWIDQTNQELSALNEDVYGGSSNYTEGAYLIGTGVEVADDDYCISEKVILSADALSNGIYWYYGTYRASAALVIYDSSDSIIDYYEMLSGAQSRRISSASLGSSAYAIKFSFAKGYECKIEVDTTPRTVLWFADASKGLVDRVREQDILYAASGFSGLPISIVKKFSYLGLPKQQPPYSPAQFSFLSLLQGNELISCYDNVGIRYLEPRGEITIDNTELYWNKLVFVPSLCDFDFDGVFVKYEKDDSYNVEMLGIIKNGESLTELEQNIVNKVFGLPAFRMNELSLSGLINEERPLSKKAYNNLVADPAFLDNSTWTHGTEWKVLGNGLAKCNDPNANQGSLLQTIPLDIGQKYRISFKVSGIQSGAIVFHANYNEYVSESIEQDGAYMFEFVPTGTGVHSNEIMFRPGNAGFVGNIEFVELLAL